MPKNIVICCDGTNNEFGKTNTNVVRLYQSLDLSEPSRQIAYYSPGIGTVAPDHVETKLRQKAYQAWAAAVASDIMVHAEKALGYLSRYYEPHDRVFMFGFSRGAYTIRVVAGIIHKCGLPQPGNENLWPYLRRVYEEPGETEISEEYRRTFGRTCSVHFLGLWDTVSTVGLVFDPVYYDFTFNNPSVVHVRQALAVDEQRGFFRTNRWYDPQPGQNPQVVQVWFPGVHADVGGGYEDGDLWKHPLEWVMDQAAQHGVVFKSKDQTKILSGDSTIWHRSIQHNSRSRFWDLGRWVKKKYRVQQGDRWVEQSRWAEAKPRGVRAGELLHRSVIERWRDMPTYRPENLDPGIMQRLVGQLADAATTYPYA